jgi:hypothetical protein
MRPQVDDANGSIVGAHLLRIAGISCRRAPKLLIAVCCLLVTAALLCASAFAQSPTAGISGNPTTIAPGGNSTLTWVTSNAVSADLNGTNVALNGSQVVSPTTTTTYRITAHAANGSTDWGQVTITVTASGAPTASITANPTSISAGGSSTLTWSSTNATSATLNGASVAVNGSQVVSPTATTTYTFIAKSSSGATATSTATVTVASGGPPAAGITANPTTIAAGGSSTLTWITKNAVSADLNGTNVTLNGSQVVSPTATTTYRITAHAANGSTDWGQVTVTVTASGAPTASITANPTSISSGGSSTLTWSSTNATSATLNGASAAVNGSQVVSPTATTTYTFIAKSSSGATATSTATVTVASGGPPAAGITANPTTIAAGGSSTLTWITKNAVSADLNGTNVALNGSQVVSPKATTTYRITAHAANGSTDWGQVTVTVTASGGPTASITANPTTIQAGSSSTLTWSSTNATGATLNGDTVPVNGSESVTPTATTTYTFIAKSSSGATATSTATVTIGSGGNPTASIIANPTTIAPGGSSTLSWSSTNATSAMLNGVSVGVNGSQGVSPAATTTYTILVTSSSGATASSTATVVVSTGGGPTASLTANPITITSGGSSTLTWSSTGATSATLNGASVAVNGSQVVSPTATTTYTFNSTSSSGATTTSSATVTVTSGGNPTGQWTPVQNWPFMAAHAHLLPNGKVLFWPSFLIGNNPTVWDPIANSFSSSPLAQFNIFCSGHSFLPDGTLLITGGHNGNSEYGLPYATIYDPTADNWTQIANMQDARWYPTNTTLPNGDVLVVSGEITPGTNSTLPEIWDPPSNRWIDLTTAQLFQPLYPMMFVAPNGKVFNAGPNQLTRYLDTSGTGTWTTVGNFNYNGTRDYGSAVYYDGKVMIAGGDGSLSNAPATNTAEVIDLTASNPQWTNTSSLAFARRQFNLTLLPDGKVLATGGSKGFGFDNASFPVFQTEMWDPATGKWTTMASISVYRGYHSTALLLPDGRVVSAGGEQTGASAEIYSPPYLFNGARPTITSVSSTSVKFGQTITVNSPDAASISQVTFIRLGSVTHAFNQNQRLVHLQFSQISGGLQVTAPANSNIAPPGHYMLFLVNSNGVPSVAKIIQVTN